MRGWGRRYPSGSGVAYYAEVALGKPAGRAVGIVAAIGLVAAIPATAITGGQYVAEFIDLDAAALVFPVVVLVGATTGAGHRPAAGVRTGPQDDREDPTVPVSSRRGSPRTR
jgi:amino acid transporter